MNYGQLESVKATADKNAGDITTIQTQLGSAGSGLVQQADPSAEVTVAKGTGGTVVNVTGTDGDRRVTGVANATADNDAVNLSQLKVVDAKVDANTTAINGLDGKVTTLDGKVTTLDGKVADNTTAIANNKAAINGLDGKVTTLDGKVADNKAAIDGLDGRVGANATAINGLDGKLSQLQTEGLTFAGNTGTDKVGLGETVNIKGAGTNIKTTVTDNLLEIELADNLQVGTVTANTVAATSLTAGTGTITTLASDNITIGDVVINKDTGINAGGKKITGVAAGGDPTDAVNYGQLESVKATADQNKADIAKNTGDITAIQTQLGQAGNGLVQQADPSAEVTVAKGTGGTVVNVKGTDGDRRVTGVANATADNDAVNLGQLKAVDTKVDANTTAINGLDGKVTTLDGKVTTLEGTVADNKTAIDGLDGKVGANATAINGLDGKVTTLEGSVNGLDGKLSQLQSEGLTFAGNTGTEKVALGTTVNIKGANDNTDFTKSDAGKNIYTAVESDGTVRIGLANDIELASTGSIKIGGVGLNNTGLTIVGGPSITTAGIDAGSKKITGVAAGGAPTDAVNFSQLESVKATADQNATDIADVKTDVAKNTTDIADVKTDVAKNTTDIADVKTDVAKNTTDIADVTNQLNQIAQVADQGLTFTGDTGTNTSKLGTTVEIKGNNGITTAVNGNVITVELGKNITVDTVTAKDVTADTVTAQNVNVGNTKVTDGQITGLSNKDLSANDFGQAGRAATEEQVKLLQDQLGTQGVGLIQQAYATDEITVAKNAGGNVVNVAGTDGDRVVTGVADGKNLNDAVNVGQLNAVDSKIDNLASNLEQAFYDTNKRIDSVEKRANAGIAAAMALESAPYVPGKFTYAAGAAYHGGENAVGVTLRRTSDNGRWSITGGVAAASQGDPSFRIGISGVID